MPSHKLTLLHRCNRTRCKWEHVHIRRLQAETNSANGWEIAALNLREFFLRQRYDRLRRQLLQSGGTLYAPPPLF